MVAVRVDVDSVRDARFVPLVLEILGRYGVKASFFLSTGVDETYRNFSKYLNPVKLIRSGALRRYGLDIFSGVAGGKEVQRFDGLDMILDQGHELGLHGYRHFEWMNRLDRKGACEVRQMIARGCELFEERFGFYPRCFASPGFVVTPAFFDVLDDFGFDYSSDFHVNGGSGEGGPQLCSKTPQVPVTLALEGYDGGGVMRELLGQMGRGSCVFYFHPSGMPLFDRETLERVLEAVSGRAGPLGRMV